MSDELAVARDHNSELRTENSELETSPPVGNCTLPRRSFGVSIALPAMVVKLSRRPEGQRVHVMLVVRIVQENMLDRRPDESASASSIVFVRLEWRANREGASS